MKFLRPDLNDRSQKSVLLCWTAVDGKNSHDLLPLPYTEEALDIACRNVKFAQDFLERPLLVENPSSYVQFSESTMSEWRFLTERCSHSPSDASGRRLASRRAAPSPPPAHNRRLGRGR